MGLSNRVFTYVSVLSFYYTFTIMFNLLLGDVQVILSLVVITLFSYGWLVNYNFEKDFDVRYIDLVLRVFIYAFISFFIASSTLFMGEATVVRALFLISPISLWSFVWIDHIVHKYGKPDAIPVKKKKHLWS